MDNILNLDHVETYNQLYGLETLHPLVSVVNLNEATRGVEEIKLNYGIYALFLKMEKACDIKYGRQTYDYQAGTIVCFAPGQTAHTVRTTDRIQTNAYGILFHPDLLRGTQLGRHIKQYGFFSYQVNEALHLSDNERDIILNCLHTIRIELEQGIDRHSKTLLTTHIELLLGYCLRFYERQFITRSQTNSDLLTRFEQILDAYFEGNEAARHGLPTVKFLADRLCLSPNYFGDLLKKETGKTPQEYIHGKVIELAKERIAGTDDTVSEIAYALGFQYPQHLCRLFKKHVGCTPGNYRSQMDS